MRVAVSESDVAAYDRDGVVCLRGAFGAVWVGLLCEAVERDLVAPGPHATNFAEGSTAGKFFGDMFMWQRDNDFRLAALTSPACEIAARLMGSKSVDFFYDQLFVKEPGTAHPLQRLRALRALRDAGVNAGVLMAPVVPGFTTQPARLEATIKAVADHGAAFMGANLMYLKGGTKDHFMKFLAREFPEMVDGYERLYAGAYAKSDYVSSERAMIGLLQDRYDLAGRQRRRGESDVKEAAGLVAEQPPFDWS